MDVWTDGWLGGWMDGQMDRWIGRSVDGWWGGWMVGWMDGWIGRCSCSERGLLFVVVLRFLTVVGSMGSRTLAQ